MIFFYAPAEGCRFIRVWAGRSARPKHIIQRLEKRGPPGIYVFRCGAVYDGYLPHKMRWRRNGRRWGRARYKELMKQPELRNLLVWSARYIRWHNVKIPAWGSTGGEPYIEA